MALPNPNKELVTSSQTQTLTLKDILHYQQRTEMWSENTDVNTFRGNVEEQEQGEKLVKAINRLGGSTEGKGSLESVEEALEGSNNRIQDAFAKLGETIFKPFKGLFRNLNDKSYEEFGESLFSSSNLITRGAEEVRTGFKELTNGIGFLGPVINGIRTAIYKGVAIFKLFTGGIKLIIGSITKAAQFISRKFMKEKLGIESEGAQLERLENEEAAAQARIDEAEAKLKAKQEKEGIMGAPIPLPVTVETQTGVPIQTEQSQEKPFMGIQDAQGNILKSDKEPDLSPEELDLNKQREALLEIQGKKEELLNKKKLRNENSRFKKFGSLIKRLQAMTMLSFLKIFAIVAMLGGLVLAIKNGTPGAITSMTEIVRRGTKSFLSGMDDIATKLGFTGAGIDKLQEPGMKGNRVPKGQQVKIDGKIFKGGQYLPAGTQVSATGEVFKNGVKQSATRTVLRGVSKVATPVAGTVEAVMDVKDNDKKFEAIKAAYDAGEEFVPDGEGGMRKMTSKEFEQLEKAQTANFSGSIGKGIGATLGAIGGGALVGFMTGGPIGAIVGAIGGGIGGAMVGDDAGTGLAEIFTGTENSQDILDNLYDLAKPMEDAGMIEDANRQISDGNIEMQTRPREGQQYYNQQQVVNNQNDTFNVGKTPFSNEQLAYSYGD